MSQPHDSAGGVPNWLQSERSYDDQFRERGTIPELFEQRATAHADSQAQLYKGGVYNRSIPIESAQSGEYESLTYGELHEFVRHLAAGFRELGVEHSDRIGIFASTRMEWAQADLGLLAAGAVVTTVYTDSSPNQVEYLLGDPEASGVVVENEELLDRVLAVEDNLDLSFVVLLDDPDTEYDREDIHTLGDVLDVGQAAFDEERYQSWLDDTSPDDLASIIYTSGTTGKPKGVRLTHWNFRRNVHQVQRRAGPREDDPDRLAIDDETVTISFLPLAHVFERLAGHFLMFGSGATVGYTESSDTITEDIQKIRPHTGASVPRVYERIFDNMRTQASEGAAGVLTKPIFRWSLGIAREYAREENPGTLLEYKYALADRLVFSTVKEKMGGRIEFMISGGGSLSEDLARLFKGMGIPILEGYGLTETSPVVSVNTPEDVRPGTLGPPAVGVEIAFDESQAFERERAETDGVIGELLVRGDNISAGYWRKPGATDRAFVENPFEGEGSEAMTRSLVPTATDEDGKWFRTGDLIEQTADGFLVFHERLKQIFVLSTGKNVAPGPIEDLFAVNDRVEQVMVVGDDEKFVGALIVPNFERLQTWAGKKSLDLPEDRDALCEDERVREWIQDAVDEANEELERVQKVKEFALVPDEWTAENDMLTPSMKKKRRNILTEYDEHVATIYDDEE